MENTIYENFRKIVHYQRNKQREYLEQFGLHYGQPRTLKALYQNPNTTQSELVTQLEVSKEAISMSIKRLSQNGLVIKTRDPHDKRITRLNLSEKGEQVYKESFSGIDQLNQELFAQLTQTEKETLSAIFNKIITSKEAL